MNSNGNGGRIVLAVMLKYLLEGVAVSLAASLVPRRQLRAGEVIALGVTAAATFLLLDMFAPAVGGGARHGSGFAVGARLVGGLEGFEGSARNHRIRDMHNQMVMNDVYRMKHTGGSLHEDDNDDHVIGPELDSDYKHYPDAMEQAEEMNANVEEFSASEKVRTNRLLRLNRIGRVGNTRASLERHLIGRDNRRNKAMGDNE